jgi:hypothetical protein
MPTRFIDAESIFTFQFHFGSLDFANSSPNTGSGGEMFSGVLRFVLAFELIASGGTF